MKKIIFIIIVVFASCKTTSKIQKSEASNVEIMDSVMVKVYQGQYDVSREESREINITYPLDTGSGYYEAVIKIGRDSQITVKSNKPIKGIRVKEYKSLDSSGFVVTMGSASYNSYSETKKMDFKETKKWSSFWFWFFVIIAVVGAGYGAYRIGKIKF